MTQDIKTYPAQDVKSLVERLRDTHHIMQGDGLAALIETCEAAADALSLPQAVEPVTRADLLWLERAKDAGHAGEGTMERKGRDEHNARIDRILSALAHPHPAGDAPSQTDARGLVSAAFHDGFMAGLKQEPWDEASDWAALAGDDYADDVGLTATANNDTPAKERLIAEMEYANALRNTAASLHATLKRLTFAARTTGGIAGPDPELQAACDQAEALLSGQPSQTSGEDVERKALVAELRALGDDCKHAHYKVVSVALHKAAAVLSTQPTPIQAGGDVVGALEPFAEAARNAEISGRPPWEFVDASAYERARQVLAALAVGKGE